MLYRTLRLVCALAFVATVFVGCRGCLCESLWYEHRYNRPDCGLRPCPRECPEFELPPGGPYLTTPELVAPEARGLTVKTQAK